MSATIDGLLELARAESSTALGGSCLLADALEEAVAWPHGSGSVTLDVDEELRIALDQALAVRALGPVIGNATQHGSRVRVTATAVDGWVDVNVDDDGPGVAAADREALFVPGRTTTGGAGLGLPLARRVARSAGGDVAFAETASGARVVVRLPRR
jgi:signal transduction histidine kinase